MDVFASEPVAFVGVNVVPMDSERVLLDQTIITKNGRIISIGNRAETVVPAEAKKLDSRGKYLLPGLADMHVHLFDERDFLLYLANGVTVIRNMYGEPRHIVWKQKIARGELLGPTMITSGPFLDGDPPASSNATVVRTAQDARRYVFEHKTAGYDFIKVYSTLPPTIHRAIMTAAEEAGIRAVGHVPWAVGVFQAAEAGQYSAEHLHTYPDAIEASDSPTRGRFAWERVFHAIKIDETKIPELAARVRDAGLWTCPTIITGDRRLATEGARQAWNNPTLRQLGEVNRRKIVKGFRDAGARLLLGSDAVSGTTEVVPGISIHEELQTFVSAGLTPYEALRAGTADAAEFLGQSQEFGTIAEGKRTDLLLVEANPLEQVSNVSRLTGIMVRGKWFESSSLKKSAGISR